MKMKLALCTALSALCALPTVAVAFADEQGLQLNEPYLPTTFEKELTLTALADVAFDDDGTTIAFAEDHNLYLYADSELTTIYHQPDRITNVEYTAQGWLFMDASQQVYRCDEKQNVSLYTGNAFTFSPKTNVDSEAYYYYVSENGLNMLNKGEQGVTTENGVFAVARTGSTIYALKPDGVYAVSGTTLSKQTYLYCDYSATKQITIGTTATLLRQAPLQTATAVNGAQKTAVDLNALDGDVFVTGATTTATEGTFLVLAQTAGNACIVAAGTKTYLMKTDDLTITPAQTQTAAWTTGIANTSGRLYATPFIGNATQVGAFSLGDEVRVLGKTPTALKQNGVISNDFYFVELTHEGQTVQGYAVASFFTEKSNTPATENQTQIELEDELTTQTKTAAILVMMSVLVAATLGYIAYLIVKAKHGENN